MISLVINVKNGADTISRCIESAIDIVGEVIIVDDESTDNTIEIASKYTKKIFKHKSDGYVEPSRNFAIAKATGNWILLLDADEVISTGLKKKLQEIHKDNKLDYIKIPRVNLIFNKQIRHSGWWPDYQVRFFRKGKINWLNKIHSQPEIVGKGTELEINDRFAIIHENYKTIGEYIFKMNNYTEIQAKEALSSGQKFNLGSLLSKPFSEFSRRYFIWKGYEDGMHGLVLAILQAFSEFILQLKIWQLSGFKEYDKSEVIKLTENSAKKSFIDFNKQLPKNKLKKLKEKIATKFL